MNIPQSAFFIMVISTTIAVLITTIVSAVRFYKAVKENQPNKQKALKLRNLLAWCMVFVVGCSATAIQIFTYFEFVKTASPFTIIFTLVSTVSFTVVAVKHSIVHSTLKEGKNKK